MPEASIADLLAGATPPPPPVLPSHLQQYVDSLPAEQQAEGMRLALASLAGQAPPTPPPAPPVVIEAPVVVTTTPPATPPAEPPKRKRGRPPVSATLQIIVAGLTGGATLDTIKACIELAAETE